MFLKCSTRRKDGKIHRSWSIVECRRVGPRVLHHHVLYLGEVTDQQRVSWERAVHVIDETNGQGRQLVLIPAAEPAPTAPLLAPASAFAPASAPVPALLGTSSSSAATGATLTAAEVDALPVRLSALRLERPRQWGACWLADALWRELRLDKFFSALLGGTREGTDWEKVLRTLTIYRLLSPGSEWRLHRHWFATTALPDLLAADESLAQPTTLYRCHDLLLAHKEALFAHLRARWSDLFAASYDILLYDLTSTYFECDQPEAETEIGRAHV